MNPEFRRAVKCTPFANRVLRGQPSLPRGTPSVLLPLLSEERDWVANLFRQQWASEIGPKLLMLVYQWIASTRRLKTCTTTETSEEQQRRKGWKRAVRVLDKFLSNFKIHADACESELKRFFKSHARDLIEDALLETDNEERTVFHLAILHQMPPDLILQILDYMKEDYYRKDVTNRSAVDYLLDWEEINREILTRIAAPCEANDKHWEEFKVCLLRLCRRNVDGHTYLEFLLTGKTLVTQEYLTKLMEEAIKQGSCMTVRLLLEKGADPSASSRCNSLLHDAANSKHDSIDKIKLLVTKVDPSQTNPAGFTLLHLGANSKPPRMDLIEFALECGVNVSKKDKKGDTALHKVVKNYADRDIPWDTSEQVMELLLKQPSLSPNTPNKQGFTPFRLLTRARTNLSPQLLLKWLICEADLGIDLENIKTTYHRSPLAELCRRSNGHDLFKYWRPFLKDQTVKQCYFCMLQTAVKEGSGKMVKALLDIDISIDHYNSSQHKQAYSRLLKFAVTSKIDNVMKIQCLSEKGLQLPDNMLLAVAESDSFRKEVLHVCADNSNFKQQLVTEDECGNTALHIAAMSKHQCSEILVRSLAEATLHSLTEKNLQAEGLHTTLINRSKETPFALVLQKNHSEKELRKNKVMILLESGYQPTLDDFKLGCKQSDGDDFKNLFLSSGVISKSKDPIRFLLVLGSYCQYRFQETRSQLSADQSTHKGIQKQTVAKVRGNDHTKLTSAVQAQALTWRLAVRWRDLNMKFEKEAVMMIEVFSKYEQVLDELMTTEDIEEAKNLKWRKFLASRDVSELVLKMFYGQVNTDGYEDENECPSKQDSNKEWLPQKGSGGTWYHIPTFVALFLLQSFLLPFYLLRFFLCCCCNGSDGPYCRRRNMLRGLIIDPTKNPAVTFYSNMIGYLTFLGFLIARIVYNNAETSLTWIEWVILSYIAAMIAEEIYQMCTEKTMYLNITNILDLTIILSFCCFFAIRILGSTTSNLLMVRISEHVFAVAAGISFIRVLNYTQVSYKLGPIQFAFIAITTEVLSFIVILGVVWIAFGVAISGVYNAGVHTIEFKNESIAFPKLVSGVWPSLQTLYWSLFSNIDYHELRSEYDVLWPERGFTLILFALWLLLSVIVLLNMLIALINAAFDRVRTENADFVWNLAVTNIIRDIKKSPSFPLPVNFLYLSTILLSKIFNCCENFCQQEEERRTYPHHTFTVKSNFKLESMMQAYVHRKAKHKREHVTLKETDALEEKGISTAQQTNEMKDWHLQLQTRLCKQIKTVETLLLQSQDHIKRRSNHQIGEIQESSSQACFPGVDNDIAEENTSLVRYERVRYEAGTETVSKIGDEHTIGGWQLLEKPMSKEFWYFEVTVVNYGQMGKISVGLAHSSYHLNTMLGVNNDSIAYQCEDGHLIHAKEVKTKIACSAQEGDVIGCGIRVNPSTLDFDSSPIVFFTLNGEEIGNKKINSIHNGGFFPTVGLCSKGERVQVNWDVQWKPHNITDLVTTTKQLATKQRKTQDCLTYNEYYKILSYSSGQQRFAKHVGIFQDLSHPIGAHFNYFEVELLDMGMTGQVCIGLANATYPLNTMPGLKSGSVAYHCDDGNVFRSAHSRSRQTPTFSPASRGDLIGCGLEISLDNHRDTRVFFTRNHTLLGKFEMGACLDELYPTIGMMNYGEEVKLHFNAKWPPPTSSGRNSTVKYRSNCVHVNKDIIKFVGHTNNIGVYQDVSRPISREFSYYEVTVKDYGAEGKISVGLAGRTHSLDCHPGWLKQSVAWHCNNGFLYEGQASTTKQYKPAKERDVIGCKVDFIESQKRSAAGQTTKDVVEFVVIFTRNGEYITDATIQVPEGGLFPTVGMQTAGEVIQINTSPQVDKLRGAANRSITQSVEKFERVQIRDDCVFYLDNKWNDVGGLQLKTNMQDQKYFEVEILNKGDRGTIGIGIAQKHYRLDCQPGWADGSIAYHCDDGELHWNSRHKPFSESSSTDDVIGCGIDKSQNAEDDATVDVFFTRNGIEINREKFNYKASDLYPTVCMHSHDEAVKIILTAQSNKENRKSPFSRSQRVEIIQTDSTETVQYKVQYKSDANNNAGAVQLSNKISKEASYFEVTIFSLGNDGAIGVGLAPSDYPLDCMPGWLPGSIGYHSDDGCLFEGANIGQPVYERGEKGTTLGCGVDYNKSKGSNLEVYFKYNGQLLTHTSTIKCPRGGLFPTIGLAMEGDRFTYTSSTIHSKSTSGTMKRPKTTSNVETLSMEHITSI